jgi:hypothetical protein
MKARLLRIAFILSAITVAPIGTWWGCADGTTGMLFNLGDTT